MRLVKKSMSINRGLNVTNCHPRSKNYWRFRLKRTKSQSPYTKNVYSHWYSKQTTHLSVLQKLSTRLQIPSLAPIPQKINDVPYSKENTCHLFHYTPVWEDWAMQMHTQNITVLWVQWVLKKLRIWHFMQECLEHFSKT